jgi:hypothetical protein
MRNLSHIGALVSRVLISLRQDSSGVNLIEFALVLPILLALTGFGVELTNTAFTTKKVGDLAVLAADNASRMGHRNVGISEAQINDVFIGSQLQAGIPDFAENGSIVLSSLQRNADGGQWIAWQRCFGENGVGSAYGEEGDGETGTSFRGMGPPDNLVTAPAGSAVMVVEVSYDPHRVLPFVSAPVRPIREIFAFIVRENRILSDPTNAEEVEVSDCE